MVSRKFQEARESTYQAIGVITALTLEDGVTVFDILEGYERDNEDGRFLLSGMTNLANVLTSTLATVLNVSPEEVLQTTAKSLGKLS